MLQRWWEKKYSLPSNHELFQSRTFFDLAVEFLVDRFEKNPLEVHRQADGEVQFIDTGDDLIDKWEQQLADGDDIDLMEAFTPESMERLKELQAQAKGQKSHVGSTPSIADTVKEMEKHAKPQELPKRKISTFGRD